LDYIDKLDYRPCSGLRKLLHSAALSLDLALQPVKEITRIHKQHLKQPYIKEQTLRRWLPNIYNTLQGFIFRHYFSPEAQGTHNIPEHGAMLVANHSGMWGWDGMALQYAIFQETGRTVTGMAHRIFDGSDLAKTLGMSTGTRENAINLLNQDRLVLVCPGGGREAVKPYKERYKVQRVAGFARHNYGYLLTALEAKKPIVPVGIVGAEETHMILANIKPQLNKIADALYNALPQSIKKKAQPYKQRWDTAKVFPLMLNIIPFPSQITMRIGRPFYFHDQSGFPAGYFRQLKDLKKKFHLSAEQARDYQSLDHKLHNMNEDVLDSIQDLLGPCLAAHIPEESKSLILNL
jgi:1-acyl-sn-glycerol-3-phosphate acyltransferase